MVQISPVGLPGQGRLLADGVPEDKQDKQPGPQGVGNCRGTLLCRPRRPTSFGDYCRSYWPWVASSAPMAFQDIGDSFAPQDPKINKLPSYGWLVLVAGWRRTARPTGLGASGCARRLLQGRPSLVGREEKRTGSATRNPSSPLDSFGAGWGSSEETAEAGPNRFLEGRQVRQWVGISLINSG